MRILIRTKQPSPTVPTSSKDWQNRYEAIRAILRHRPVGSQAELCRSLRSRGFRVTQSSVSRDLAELHAVKIDGHYVLSETIANGNTPGAVLARAATDILSVRPAGPYLLVVRTPPGRASSVGLAIDAAGWPDIVGTVAGDDTLFVAITGRRNQASIEARLLEVTRNPRP